MYCGGIITYRILFLITKNLFRKNKMLVNYYKICDFYKKHNKLFIPRLYTTLKNKDIVKYNITCYLQLILYRSKALLHNLFVSILLKNIIGVSLSIRAHYELAGCLGYLLNKIIKYKSGEIDKNELIKITDKLTLGTKNIQQLKQITSINVITMIKQSDKLLNDIFYDDKNMLMNNYEYLSEFCHPNSYGLIFSANIFKNYIKFHKYSHLNNMYFKLVRYITLSLIPFFLFFDKIKSYYK